MEYTDEKIVLLKMEQREQQMEMSLEDGYYINGKLEQFSLTKLFDEQISVYLPQTFVDMPEQISALKYPSSFRPQIIKTNLECNVNFLFNILDNPDRLTTKQAANSFRQVLAKTNPAMKINEIKAEKKGEVLDIICFDFISYGVDEQIYNFMCLVAFGGTILQGVFNCQESSRFDWKNAVREVFLNLKINSKRY